MTRTSSFSTRPLSPAANLVLRVGLACAVTTAVAGTFQGKPQFSDKKGQFALWFREQSFEFPDTETILFAVTGNPVKGYSRDQNIDFSCNEMTGKIRKSANGAMMLEQGVMTGEASVDVTDANSKSHVESSKVKLDDDGLVATLTMPSPFVLTNDSAQTEPHRNLVFKAPSGTFKFKSLKTKDKHPLVSADVAGPVSLTVEELGAAGKKSLYSVTGAHMTVLAVGDDTVVNVSGGVHVSSETSGPDNKGFQGDWDVSQATVTLDPDFNLKKIQAKGEPGTGILKEKKGG